jgi:phospholipid/cholesterol/gamma-HCH transport system ATP-binding protein
MTTATERPGPPAGPGAGAVVDPVVRLAGVSYSVAGRTILDHVDLSIARGKVTAIMGPSGTGKTTLLRLITGQLRATQGTVTVAGVDIGRLPDDELYAFRKRMGMLFQNGALLTDIDVFENVAFPLREHTKLPEELIARIVLMKLQSVGLRGAARLMPSELSGGMARRVALARAIVMDPELLIYDEPFAGLDPIAMGVVLRLIRQTNDALGITSIVVSHDVHEVGLLADETLLLSGGGVAASGPPSELQKHASDAVRQFMNGLPDGPVPFHYPAPDYARQLLDGEGPA